MFKRIKAWKTRKFLAQQAPCFTKGDGGQWILDKFQEQIGRPFNPFSYDDRRTIEIGLDLARIRALDHIFSGFSK